MVQWCVMVCSCSVLCLQFRTRHRSTQERQTGYYGRFILRDIIDHYLYPAVVRRVRCAT